MDGRNPSPLISPGASILELSDLESGIGNHLCKLLLGGKLLDGFDEVLVRRPITGENGTKKGDNGERVLLVEP